MSSVYSDNILCGPWFDSAYLDLCCKATRTDDPPMDSTLLDSLIMISSEAMYYWLGRQFRGECEVTFRPDVCSCGRSRNECCCGAVSQIDLGFFPVTSLASIWLEGAAQNPDDYHIDEYRFLVANDGAPFPVVQNLYSTPGDTNDIGPDQFVFEVEITYGQPVPELAKRAGARLACELAKSCMDLPCQLPERTISVMRQGVSTQQFSAQDILNQGLIGILEIDLALRAYNPAHIQSPSFVWSPDLKQGGRRTHT